MKPMSTFGLSLAAVIVASALVACGGGSTTSSSSTPSAAATPSAAGATTNTAVGSVTGFGSIVVDGIHYDDSVALVQRENAPGTTSPADAKLGHRVMVTFDSKNFASKIELLPELEGPIASIDSVKMRFVVNGLTVVINTDASAGPATVFGGGYAGFADLKVTDTAEVHGLPKLDTLTGAASNTYVVQATRIEKRTAPGPFLRAGGFVQNLTSSATATTFAIGGLTVDATGVTPKPAGVSLANGQYVFVASTQAVTTNTMKATSIRVLDRKPANATDVVRLAGTVGQVNVTAVTFDLDGVTVNAKTASILPKGATPTNGAYARASGTFDAKGELIATEVQLHDEAAPSVEVKGSVANFTSISDFTVRGVPVDAIKATLTGCPATGIANNQFVLIHATVTLTSPKVQASTIACTADAAVSVGVMIEREGVASAIDTAGKALTLTMRGGAAIKVTWTSTTFFDGAVTAATVSGATIEVEGVLAADGSLAARKIRPHR